MPASITAPLARFYGLTRREGECLVWTGHCIGTKSQRPRFRHTTNQHDPQVYAHRWIYEQKVGPIPPGYEVDHTCKNGICVEWTHLEVVPPLENQARERLVLCTEGLHDLTNPDSCVWDQRGRRRGCKMCKRTKALAYYHNRKGGQ